MSEGNIISFKVFVDAKGRLMTEYSKLPSSKVTNVFDDYDKPFIDKDNNFNFISTSSASVKAFPR